MPFQKRFRVSSSKREELIEITSLVQSLVTESGVKSGFCIVFAVHTTCGVTINENCDPAVASDLLKSLSKLVPNTGFLHREGNSDAHIKSSLMGSSQMVLVDNGSLCLGTWQGIFICEFDGPRLREVLVQIHSD